MGLVGGKGIPNKEFTVLRGRNQVNLIGRPVHSIDLGQVTLEGSADSGGLACVAKYKKSREQS